MSSYYVGLDVHQEEGAGDARPGAESQPQRNKNRRPRAIPMSGRVRDMMAGLYDDETSGEFVSRNDRTGLSINDIKTGFTGACREAGILNLTFHDLADDADLYVRAE
jgi:hypothetical protein